MGTNPTTGLLILKSAVSIGKQPNNTTISYETASKANIEMSFVAKRPPIPSKLFVHCPNLDTNFYKKPLILSMVDDFFLVRVVMVRPGRVVTTEDQKYDYFIYNPTLRMLDELPHPHPLVFNPNQVGLLPRGDQYTVAALVPGRNSFMYELYLFNSEARSWKSMALRVRTHLRKFPIKIPNNSSGLLRRTSNVITIGGESGTMGWVDLWSDILFCDVLHPYPELRTVPLPLPLKQINSSEGDGIILGSPRTCRGIAYIEAEHCLKFVEIRFDLSSGDDKTGSPFETKVWSVKTSRYTDKTNLWDDWYKGFEAEANDTEKTNLWDDWDKGCKAEAEANDTEKTNLWDDWDKGFEAEAKDIIIGSELSQSISELHSHHDGAVADPTLKDLFVFQPGLSIDDKQVVYLLTSGQFGGDATWVLALDLESKTLVDVAKFGTRRQLFSPVIYCRGTLGL